MAQQNGVAPGASTPTTSRRTGPTVVGINFGNTYASIAVLTKEGLADCIANEDGERQIACAVSFHGEEIYIGNQAKPQLVKNAQNTIVNFRNILGKKFSEIPKDQAVISAPVIQHPDQPDVPAYKVAILQPAPEPLRLPHSVAASVKSTSALNTPAASVLPTPRSEPTPAERILTVTEVTSIFLRALVQSAQDFLGRSVDGAVIAVPAWFDEAARSSLLAAAKEADIKVLQLLDEAAAAAIVSVTSPEEGIEPDRTSLVVDLGQSALTLTLLEFRHGLVHSLASSYNADVSGEQIDARLVKHFAKEFTKKLKVPLIVCSDKAEPADRRAEAKLRLAIEHTKRTISASPGAASCSVESMKDGLDFTSSLTRMRFDLEVRSVYDGASSAVKTLLSSASVDPLYVDELIYVGGAASLPGLDDTLRGVVGFREDIASPFEAGTVAGGGEGDPTTLLARGCALQARVILDVAEDEADGQVRAAFERGSEHAAVHATAKTVGIILPEAVPEGKEKEEGELGGQWIVGVPRETPLPYRRVVEFDCDLGEGEEKQIGFELWEVEESVKVEKVKPPKDEDEDDEEIAEEEEEEEEEKEEEIREKQLIKTSFLGALRMSAEHARKVKGRWATRISVQFVVGGAGGVSLTAWELTSDRKGRGSPTTIAIPPVVHS